MRIAYLFFLFSFFNPVQQFEVESYLNGEWCKKAADSECFSLIYDQGLLLFEVPDGGYVEGVEVIRYDEKEKKIYWKIVGTQKDTQNFRILDADNVLYFDGVSASYWFRSK
jgi:hypothetical protein